MTATIGDKIITKDNAFTYKRMIQCPGHWMIPPTVDVYLRKPVEMLKRCSNFVFIRDKKFTIKKTAIVRDKWGNKMLDWKKLYELKAKGIVFQPRVSAAWAIEHVYDEHGALCQNCPKYCKEGQGRVMVRTINRLMGKKFNR